MYFYMEKLNSVFHFNFTFHLQIYGKLNSYKTLIEKYFAVVLFSLFFVDHYESIWGTWHCVNSTYSYKSFSFGGMGICRRFLEKQIVSLKDSSAMVVRYLHKFSVLCCRCKCATHLYLQLKNVTMQISEAVVSGLQGVNETIAPLPHFKLKKPHQM